MKNVTELLKKASGITNWRVTENARDSYEVFYVHDSIETVRSTSSADVSVTVYVDHDGKTGDSTFTVSSWMTEDDRNRAIDKAAARALLVSNEKFSLPPEGRLEAELPSNMSDTAPEEIARMTAEAVLSASRGIPGGTINALEIFVYKTVLSVRNGNGLDKKQTTHRVMIEAIPTFTENGNSVELYEDYRFTSFDADKLREEISGKMREVRDRFVARKPEVPLRTDVLLRSKEICWLFYDVTDDLDYSTVYRHYNLHSMGDDLQEGRTGDPVTVELCGMIDGCDRSSYFDDDGLSLTDTRVIDRGVVSAYHGSNRFGQYMGVEKPTGVLPCMRLAPGSLGKEELESTDYLDVVSMSGIQIDLFNDYLGGEIRLAYLVKDGKKTPVTGITMSGSLSSALRSAKLSKTICTDGGYEGPDRMLIRDFEIL